MLSYWNELFPTTGMFVVVLLTTIVAATMRAFSGFGAGLLLAPILSIYLVPTDVVIIVVGLNFVATFQVLPEVRKDIDWPLIWRMVPAALVGIPLGGWLLSGLDQTLMRKLVAGVVVILSLVLLAGWHYQGRRGRIQDSFAGLTSGVLTAIGGIGGPPFVLYMMSARDVSAVAIRTFFIVFFAIMQVVTLGMFLVHGAMQPVQFAYIGTFLPVYLLATWVGSYLFARALRAKADLVRRVSLWFLLLVGIGTFIV